MRTKFLRELTLFLLTQTFFASIRRVALARLAGAFVVWVCVSGGGIAATPLGLLVSEQGEVRLGSDRFTGIGVNYYDAFVRTLSGKSVADYDPGFRELAARRIPFARFSAGGYWPRERALYQTNRSAYFRLLDGVVASAERHGVGLIPSLFWHMSTIPDLVGEPCNRWGDTNSRTHAFMRAYTREVVTRYVGSPAIWGWEFGNEYNLVADLPNAAEHRPPVVPSLGTPARRSIDDELTHGQVRTAVREFASEVRRHDPNRVIISGHATPRPSAWHQVHEKSWKQDSAGQFAEILEADNPFPVNALSVRGYDVAGDFGRLAQAMQISRRIKKPLFVGEFGVPGNITADSRKSFAAMLAALETNQVSLAALWVFDFPGQAKDWNVNPTNDRRWQLEAIQITNDRLRLRRQ